MRATVKFAFKGATVGILAGSALAGAPRIALAQDFGAHPAQQSALCPAVVTVPTYALIPGGTGEAPEFLPTPNPLVGVGSSNGSCSNDASAFSGAALASQALSELSQSTSQETTRTTGNAIVERREAERQSCPEGSVRVNGSCERIPARLTEVVPEPPAPVEEPLARAPTSRAPTKAKPAPVAQRKPAAPTVTAVRAAPPPPPVFVEPEARFGAWTQVIGDYERRTASGPASVLARLDPTGATTSVPIAIATNVSSRTGTIGFQAGADVTARGILAPDDGMIIGGFAGYVSSDLRLSTTSLTSNPALVASGSSQVSANLSGATTGVYATYFTGPFSADFLLKVDALRLNESFTDNLGFAPGPADAFTPFTFVYSGNGSTSVLNGTVAGNLNYKLPFYQGWWVEPTVGAQYTNTTYGSGAATLGLADGSLVMVQGGLRFGASSYVDNKILVTTTLTGLAYSNVLVSGGFIPGAGFNGNNILARADEGQVRGRGVFALNVDFGNGIKSFVLGEVRGGQGLIGAGGKGGVRYEW
jgi:hypothetical protein